MFQKLKERMKEKQEAKQLLREWMKEHWAHLPSYHPQTGQKLDWKVRVVKRGPFDTETGEPLGELDVIVEQKPPRQIRVDNRVFAYDENTKQIYALPAIWS